jgi:hypothetical protein
VDIVEWIETTAPPPKPRGPYKAAQPATPGRQARQIDPPVSLFGLRTFTIEFVEQRVKAVIVVAKIERRSKCVPNSAKA